MGAISYGQVDYIHVLGTTIKACHETDNSVNLSLRDRRLANENFAERKYFL